MGTVDQFHTNEELQLPPAIPTVEYGERLQTNGQSQTQPSAVPNMESRDRAKGWGFSPRALLSKRIGSLALGRIVCQLKLICPHKGKPVKWGALIQKEQSLTKRNSPTTLRNVEKDSELKSVRRVPCLYSLLSPHAIGSSAKEI